MNSGIVFEFVASHHAVVVLLGSHPSLAIGKDATVEVVLATCNKCSSKLCWLFAPSIGAHISTAKGSKNHNFGTATS